MSFVYSDADETITVFIAFKIWRIQRERGANWDMKSTFSRVTVIAIESCL